MEGYWAMSINQDTGATVLMEFSTEMPNNTYLMNAFSVILR